VDGDTTVYLTLVPGGSVSGTVTLRSARTAGLPELNQFRLSVQAADSSPGGVGGNTRVNDDGTFVIEDIAGGPRVLRGQAPRGWTLASVTAGGREITDVPLDVIPGRRIPGVSVVFTDRISEISGTVTDQQGTPITDFTVLAFPTSHALWHPQSRHIMTARPDQTGRFQLRGLPPGDYYVAVVDPVESGEWFEPDFLNEHRPGAATVKLAEGETRTQDFKIALR
jgi:hypothetical protein